MSAMSAANVSIACGPARAPGSTGVPAEAPVDVDALHAISAPRMDGLSLDQKRIFRAIRRVGPSHRAARELFDFESL